MATRLRALGLVLGAIGLFLMGLGLCLGFRPSRMTLLIEPVARAERSLNETQSSYDELDVLLVYDTGMDLVGPSRR